MEPFHLEPPRVWGVANAKLCKVVANAYTAMTTSESTELVETLVIEVKFKGSSSNCSVPVDLC